MNSAKDAVILDSLYLICKKNNSNLIIRNDILKKNAMSLQGYVKRYDQKLKTSYEGIENEKNKLKDAYVSELKEEKKKKWLWVVLVIPISYLIGSL